MEITPVFIIDIFFRFACIGQLLLLLGIGIRRPIHPHFWSFLGLCLCVISYLLLTASVPDEQYGYFRNILLIFTDATAYFFWLVAFSIFNDNFDIKQTPKWIMFTVIAYAAYYIYFFTFTNGNGFFHDLSHVIALIILIHIIYVAIQGLQDDLLDSRRKIRITFVIFTCVQFLIIIYAELTDTGLRQAPLFNLLNSAIIFVLTTFISSYLLSIPREQSFVLEPEKELNSTGDHVIGHMGDRAPNDVLVEVPIAYRSYFEQLMKFMNEGGYRQSNLTIKQLADELTIPEHQLRYLINNYLGFRNFSTFLNSYRIKEACELFKDEAQHSNPILTIALELGYGSIGPFNRAFKAIEGRTPSEYRTNHNNHS